MILLGARITHDTLSADRDVNKAKKEFKLILQLNFQF